MCVCVCLREGRRERERQIGRRETKAAENDRSKKRSADYDACDGE